MRFRRSRRQAQALGASVVALTTALAGCMPHDSVASAPFTERTADPTGVKMPKFDSPDLPSTVVPTKAPRPKSDSPCALSDITLAACLPETTALATIGPTQAVVATADGQLWLIQPGLAPVALTNIGAPARQLLPTSSVTEDRQFYALRSDSTVVRITLVPGTTPELREMPDITEPAILAMYWSREPSTSEPNAPSTRERIRTLLIGDPGIEIHSVCQGPADMPPILTASLDGVPQLTQWQDGVLVPLGGVDLNNSIGGCTVAGNSIVVAVPDAQKVVSLPLAREAATRSWKIDGAPETLIDGEFGHISHVTAIPGVNGFEVWAATTNKAQGRPGGDSDERVVRLPQGGNGGGSPD